MTIWFLRFFTIFAILLAIAIDPDQDPWVISLLGAGLGAALGALYLEKR